MSTSVVKRSEGLSNRVFIIIGRSYMGVSFTTFFPHIFPYSSVSILYLCIWFYDLYDSV